MGGKCTKEYAGCTSDRQCKTSKTSKTGLKCKWKKFRKGVCSSTKPCENGYRCKSGKCTKTSEVCQCEPGFEYKGTPKKCTKITLKIDAKGHAKGSKTFLNALLTHNGGNGVNNPCHDLFEKALERKKKGCIDAFKKDNGRKIKLEWKQCGNSKWWVAPFNIKTFRLGETVSTFKCDVGNSGHPPVPILIRYGTTNNWSGEYPYFLKLYKEANGAAGDMIAMRVGQWLNGIYNELYKVDRKTGKKVGLGRNKKKPIIRIFDAIPSFTPPWPAAYDKDQKRKLKNAYYFLPFDNTIAGD